MSEKVAQSQPSATFNRRQARRGLSRVALVTVSAGAVAHLSRVSNTEAAIGTMKFGAVNNAVDSATELKSSRTDWVLLLTNTAAGAAVLGQSQGGRGVYGYSDGGTGVFAESPDGAGLSALSTGGTAAKVVSGGPSAPALEVIHTGAGAGVLAKVAGNGGRNSWNRRER